MRQTVIWLALALLFAIGVTLSFTADSFGPTATAETTATAPQVEAPQPVVVASAAMATPEVPVAMLDDVPQKSAVSPEALARWFVAPGAPPAAETLLTPLPLAPAKAIAGPPGQRLQSGDQAGGDQTVGSRPSASQKTERQPRANARQAASGPRQGMRRIVKPMDGSVAKFESRHALPDQAVGGARTRMAGGIGSCIGWLGEA